MDLMQAVANLRQHLEAVKADTEKKLVEDLPGLESWVLSASQNPATKVLAEAVHLPAVPEVLQGLAGFLATVEAALGAAKAQGAAEAQQAAAAQPAEPDVPVAA